MIHESVFGYPTAEPSEPSLFSQALTAYLIGDSKRAQDYELLALLDPSCTPLAFWSYLTGLAKRQFTYNGDIDAAIRTLNRGMARNLRYTPLGMQLAWVLLAAFAAENRDPATAKACLTASHLFQR